MTLLEVGRVAKSHGLRGDLIVRLTTDRTQERAAPGAVFCIPGPGLTRADGQLDCSQQLVVRTAKPYQKGWLMSFVGIDSRESADEYRGTLLFAEPLGGLDDSVVFVHDLIGRRLIDQHGTDHGAILSVIDNPASDLLELADDVLVPLNFLVETSEMQVVVDVPDGLLGPDTDTDTDTEPDQQ